MRKFPLLLFVGMLFGWSLGVAAAPTPVACDPDQMLPTPMVTVTIPRQPAAKDAYSGLVHPNAAVGTLKNSNVSLAVALDSDSTTARRMDVLRFDFTGAGKFDNAHNVRLSYRDAQSATIRTTVVNVVRNNVTYPVKISGYFSQNDKAVTLNLYMSVAIQDTCTIGAQSYPVRITNGDGSLNFTEAYKGWDGSSTDFAMGGDFIYLDTGDGSFQTPATLQKGFYGHPIYVNHAWYDITLAADGSKITAAPFQGPMGRMKVACASWSALLIGTKNVINPSDLPQEASIPADHYRVIFLSEKLPATAPATGTQDVLCAYVGSQQQVKDITISPDALNEPKIGPPAIAAITANRNADTVTFSFSLKDCAGTDIQLEANQGSIADKVSFEVFNDKGVSVHTGTFEHG